MTRFRHARRATSALEFALMAPILLVLATGAMGLCLVIRARTDLSEAANAMAELVAAQATVTPAEITDFCAGAGAAMTPYASAPLQIGIASVTNTGGAAATDWSDTSCGGGAAIASPASLAAGVVPNAGDSTIVVQASYVFHNPLTLVLPATFDLSVTAYARPRANATVTYN